MIHLLILVLIVLAAWKIGGASIGIALTLGIALMLFVSWMRWDAARRERTEMREFERVRAQASRRA
jgi:O-antigen/teichoic acid export membrane protein